MSYSQGRSTCRSTSRWGSRQQSRTEDEDGWETAQQRRKGNKNFSSRPSSFAPPPPPSSSSRFSRGVASLHDTDSPTDPSGRWSTTSPSASNWRDFESERKPYVKKIGRDLTKEEEEEVAHLPPCPFETQFPTLTCLDVNCWNEDKYRHRRQRPKECWYGEKCRSYRCLRLHPVDAWKKNLREIKKQKEALYRGKEAAREEEWNEDNCNQEEGQTQTQTQTKQSEADSSMMTVDEPETETEAETAATDAGDDSWK